MAKRKPRLSNNIRQIDEYLECSPKATAFKLFKEGPIRAEITLQDSLGSEVMYLDTALSSAIVNVTKKETDKGTKITAIIQFQVTGELAQRIKDGKSNEDICSYELKGIGNTPAEDSEGGMLDLDEDGKPIEE